MELADLHKLVEVVGGVDAACRDRAALTAAVAAAARLRAWLDGRDVAVAAQLAEVVSFAEQDIAAAARTSQRDAERVRERGRTAEAIPQLGDALAEGEVSGGHVDVIGRALRQLEPHQRGELVGRAGWLVALAKASTPDELGRSVAAAVRHIEADGGMARLERQKRAARLRSWVDGDGMWCISGRFDPETGVRLHGRISATVDALFAERVPVGCPSDPIERQGFLRAHALVALIEGTSPVGGAGRSEVIVVVDTTSPDPTGAPSVDWGLPVEIPVDVIRRWFDVAEATARVVPVVVHDGLVIYAPGRLDLGRATRLANRAQRRVLRGLYPTCAIPGCGARFEQCKLHHVTWWEHGGGTDLANLLPLCVTHHHAVHDRGWLLELTPDRLLTINYPDGTTQTTRPPRRNTHHHPPYARTPVAAHREPATVLRT